MMMVLMMVLMIPLPEMLDENSELLRELKKAGYKIHNHMARLQEFHRLLLRYNTP